MKKLFIALLLGLLFSGNANAKYLDIVCTPDMEYGPGPDYKDKKIWFTNNKPKYQRLLIIPTLQFFHHKGFSLYKDKVVGQTRGFDR